MRSKRIRASPDSRRKTQPARSAAACPAVFGMPNSTGEEAASSSGDWFTACYRFRRRHHSGTILANRTSAGHRKMFADHFVGAQIWGNNCPAMATTVTGIGGDEQAVGRCVMGAFGSGRALGASEDSRSIDVSRLHKTGCLRPGSSGG
jgi:hypothetical protein